mmetsp:Transcript_32926/g.72733  ORF Transcript_32926/g.72733 Transcript_32926/m.72733 type:complete len:218 (-) Transcript_32926:1052-1705(-)
MLQQTQQLADQVVQVGGQHVGVSALAEVDDCSAGVGLHPGCIEVLHDRHEGGQDLGMVGVLQVGAQVSAHLAQRLAGSPANLGVWVLQTLDAHVHQRTQLLAHHLGAALSNLRQTNESGMPLLPVRVLQELGQQGACCGHDGVTSQSNGDAVQVLLPSLVQVPTARLLMLVAVSIVPQGVILHIQQEQHAGLKQAAGKVRQLAHHARGLVARLTQGH